MKHYWIPAVSLLLLAGCTIPAPRQSIPVVDGQGRPYGSQPAASQNRQNSSGSSYGGYSQQQYPASSQPAPAVESSPVQVVAQPAGEGLAIGGDSAIQPLEPQQGGWQDNADNVAPDVPIWTPPANQSGYSNTPAASPQGSSLPDSMLPKPVYHPDLSGEDSSTPAPASSTSTSTSIDGPMPQVVTAPPQFGSSTPAASTLPTISAPAVSAPSVAQAQSNPTRPALPQTSSIASTEFRSSNPAAQTLLSQATAQMASGNIAGAAGSLQRAHSNYPNDPAVLYYLGELRLRQGQPSQALNMALNGLNHVGSNAALEKALNDLAKRARSQLGTAQ